MHFVDDMNSVLFVDADGQESREKQRWLFDGTDYDAAVRELFLDDDDEYTGVVACTYVTNPEPMVVAVAFDVQQVAQMTRDYPPGDHPADKPRCTFEFGVMRLEAAGEAIRRGAHDYREPIGNTWRRAQVHEPGAGCILIRAASGVDLGTPVFWRHDLQRWVNTDVGRHPGAQYNTAQAAQHEIDIQCRLLNAIEGKQ